MDAPAIMICAVLGAVVGWFALVPLVERIPEPMPLSFAGRVGVVVVTAALWGLDANKFTRWWVVVVYLVVFSTLVAVSVVDLRLYRLPDRMVFPGLLATVVLMVIATFVLTDSTDPLKFAATGLLSYFLILFVFHLIYPAGMGFGDVKLALLMGAALGWIATSVGQAAYLVTLALFYGCIFGIVFGLAVRIVSRQRGAFPFGPALALATTLVILTFNP